MAIATTSRPGATTSGPSPAPAVAGKDPSLEGLAGVRRFLLELAVEEVPLARVPAAIQALAGIERLVVAARVRLGHRVAGEGGPSPTGARDAASFLAQVTGTSTGKARAELALAERLALLPEVAHAYEEGHLSTDQAQVVAAAAGADPAATGRLLAVAREGSFRELRALAARTERAARREADQVERERRVHLGRYCRTWSPPEGGLRLDAWVTTLEGAKLVAALEKRTDQLLDGAQERAERLRADALVDLVCAKGVHTEVLVRADAAALVRGEVHPTEVCEIQGVGPLSVTAARSVLGEAFCTLLVKDGADITTVTSTTRVVPRRVRRALTERDPCCVVPGCGATLHLEIDHWRLDFARGGLTTLDNLCRLCSVHHKMKTQGGWKILGGPGKWRWVPPRAGPGRRGP